jgi:hypothetical protein
MNILFGFWNVITCLCFEILYINWFLNNENFEGKKIEIGNPHMVTFETHSCQNVLTLSVQSLQNVQMDALWIYKNPFHAMWTHPKPFQLNAKPSERTPVHAKCLRFREIKKVAWSQDH